MRYRFYSRDYSESIRFIPESFNVCDVNQRTNHPSLGRCFDNYQEKHCIFSLREIPSLMLAEMSSSGVKFLIFRNSAM
jgi:hypothetical protein